MPYYSNGAIVYGLNLLVSYVVTNRGDGPIPASGLLFSSIGADLTIKSHAPGSGLDITYDQAASVLRGIWELTAFHGAFTLDMDMFVGGLTPASYRGVVQLHLRVAEHNATAASVAPVFTDTAKLLV